LNISGVLTDDLVCVVVHRTGGEDEMENKKCFYGSIDDEEGEKE